MFEMSPEGFSPDGRPLRLLSGALHSFRVLPEQWPHRLRRLRAMGLSTVETYVPWNLHEPRPGVFDFDGIADLDRFLLTSREAGPHAIVRPSPYICAEWDNGGLPWWLHADREVRALRCGDPAMCMEFWCGWFDHWGTGHVVRDTQDAAEALAEVLRAGASVNVCMAHGGTNSSTWAGASTEDPATGERYRPTVSTTGRR